MRRDARVRAAPRPGVLLGGLALLFHLDKVLLGPWAYVRVHDVFDSDYFRYAEMGRLLRAEGWFSWFPHFVGGMPAYAWHHTPFYALCLLASVVPVWLIYHAMTIGLMAAAGWGMFRLLRDRLRVGAETALFCGAFFMLVSQVQQNSIPETVFNYAFPLFYVWSLEAWERRGLWRRALPPLAGAALLLALSYPVLTLPFFPVLQAATLALDETLEGRRLGALCWVAALWAGYVLACLPVLVSLFAYAPLAARRFDAWAPLSAGALLSFPAVVARQFASTSSTTLTIAPLFGALATAASARRVRRALGLWAGLLLVAALCGSELSRLWAGTILAKMDLGHFTWTLTFAAVLAAALGFDELGRRGGLRARYAALYAGAFVFILAASWAAWTTSATLWLQLWGGAAAAAAGAAVLSGKRGRPLWIALAVLVVAVRWARIKGDEPEREPYRLTLEDRSYLGALKDSLPGPVRAGVASGMPQAVLAAYDWETVDGRGPIMNRRYKEFFRLIIAPQLQDPARAAFFDSYWYNLFLNPYGAVPAFNFNLLALANVKVLVANRPLPQLEPAAEEVRRELTDSDRWLAGWGRRKLRPEYVYVLRDTFPRAFLVERVRVLADDAAVLSALSGATLPELRSTAYLSAVDAGAAALDPAPAAPAKGPQSVRLTRYGARGLEADLELSRPGALVVSDNFDPRWRAFVDGAPAPVVRADHAFLAVLVQQGGRRHVTLEFHDGRLGPAHWGLLVGALLISWPLWGLRLTKM